MICPKCGGRSVFDASGEAPDGVEDWKKCMSCGKRWSPTSQPVRVAVVEGRERFSGEDDVELDARAAAHSAEDRESAEFDLGDDGNETTERLDGVQRKCGRPSGSGKPVKEASMGAWTEEARERHRQRMREAWEARRAGTPGKVKRFKNETHRKADQVARRIAKQLAGGGTMPAVVEAAPLVATVASGNVLTLLDRLLSEAQADVQALERVREMLMRKD